MLRQIQMRWIVFFLAFFVPIDADGAGRPPEALFRSVCASCHGPSGEKGRSWITERRAPRLSEKELPPEWTKQMVRLGSEDRGMPAFGREVISDEELDALAAYVQKGAFNPLLSKGKIVHTVRMIDEPPFYVPHILSIKAGETVRWVNAGRTWHTATVAEGETEDSGLIGVNQSEGEEPDAFYLKTFGKTGLNYIQCRLHPYMQMVIGVGRPAPALSEVTLPPKSPPAGRGIGELWVAASFQETAGKGKEPAQGVVQIIDTTSWGVSHLLPLGNKPHSLWASNDSSLVYLTSWHDNYLQVMESASKRVVKKLIVGPAPAQVMTVPTNDQRVFVSIMGSVQLREINGRGLNVMPPLQGTGSGPEGFWISADGLHILAANTLSDDASYFQIGKSETAAITEPHNYLEIARIPTGSHPRGASISPDGATGFVSNSLSGTVTVLDLVSRPPRKIKEIPVGPMPVQLPADPTGRYLVVADQSAMRVDIIDLKRQERIASARAGLGAHAVTYGAKEKCDNDPASPCYFAYVTHTFENYISVYDLESIGEAVRANRPEPGHFLINGKKSALTLSCKECIEGIHIGDIPLTLTKGHPPKRAFLHHRHLGIDLAAGAETGGQGLLVIKPLLPPWGPIPIK